MAIIKYSLDNGRIPGYINDGGYYPNSSDNTIIGIGSGGGTVLSKSELITRVLAIHANSPMSIHPAIVQNNMNDSQVTADVTAWCTARSIS